MHKRNVLLSLLFSAGILLTGCGKNESPQAQQDRQPQTPPPAAEQPAPQAVQPQLPAKIIIGLDDNFPPMGFRDEQDKLVGFDIDMAAEAARRMGIEVEFKPISWNAKEAELNSKRVDALWNGLTITEQRKQHIAFTAPYMENHQIIIVTAASPIKTKADLAGKAVGVQQGSSAVDAVKNEPEIAATFKEFKEFGDNVTALLDLSQGRLDAVVVDEVVGRYYTAKKPGEYVVLEENFGTEDYGVGLRKEDAELLEHLQKAMDEMKADGTSPKIATRWFGKDIIK